MKKNLLVITILVAVATLAYAGLAYAQDTVPTTPTTPTYEGGIMERAWGGSVRGMGNRGSMMGTAGRAMMGGGTMLGGIDGPMHAYMLDAYAQVLGLTTEEIQTQIDTGKTMWQIVADQGYNDDEIKSVMLQARTVAINAMVADGLLTQEQADFRIERMSQMFSSVEGCPMTGAGTRSMQGRGRWSQPATP